MKSIIFVILLLFCASLAIPVPVAKSNDGRSKRELSAEELELELEDIEKRVIAVRTKIEPDTHRNAEEDDVEDEGINSHKPLRQEKIADALQEILKDYVQEHRMKAAQAVKLVSRALDLFGYAFQLSSQDKLAMERRLISTLVGDLHTQDEFIQELKTDIKSDIATFNVKGQDVKLFVRLKVEEQALLRHLSQQEKETIIKIISEDVESEGEVAPPTPDQTEALKAKIEEMAAKTGMTKQETKVLETVFIGALEFRSSVKPTPTEKLHSTPAVISPSPVAKQHVEIKMEPEQEASVTKDYKNEQIEAKVEKVTSASPTARVQSTGEGVDQVQVIVETVTPTPPPARSETVGIKVEKITPKVNPTENPQEKKDAQDRQSNEEHERELEDLTSSDKEEPAAKVQVLMREKTSDEPEQSVTVEKIKPDSVSVEKVTDGVNPSSEERQKEEEEKDLEGTGRAQSKVSTANDDIPVKVEDLDVPETPVMISVSKEAPPPKSTEKVDITVEKITPPPPEVQPTGEITVEKITPATTSEKAAVDETSVRVEKVSPENAGASENYDEDDDLKTKVTGVETILADEKRSGEPEQSVTVEKITPDSVSVEKVTDGVNPSSEIRQKEEEEKDLEGVGSVQSKVSTANDDIPVKVEDVPETPVMISVSRETPPPKRTEKVDITVEKGTPPSPTPEVQPTVEITVEKISPPETSEKPETFVRVEKVSPENTGASENYDEDDDLKTKVTGVETILADEKQLDEPEQSVTVEKIAPDSVSVEKVTEEVPSKKTETPIMISVSKETQPPKRTEKVDITVEKITPPPVTPEVQPTVEITVEKITPPKTSENEEHERELKDLASSNKDEPAAKVQVINRKKTSDETEQSVAVEKIAPDSISVEKVADGVNPSSEERQKEEEEKDLEGVANDVIQEDEPLKKTDAAVMISVSKETPSPKRMEKVDITVEKVTPPPPTPEVQPTVEITVEKITPAAPETVTFDEKKLVRDFEEALELERHGKKKPPSQPNQEVMSSVHVPVREKPKKATETQKTETEVDLEELENELEKKDEGATIENQELKRGLEEDELELDALAKDVTKEENGEAKQESGKIKETKSSDLVVTVEKVPATKDKGVLSEEETAKEEKKLYEELAREIDMEKKEKQSPPVVMKVEKLTTKEKLPPAESTETVEGDDEIKSEEQDLEEELEDEKLTDVRIPVKRGARSEDLNEQLERLLSM